ncbi:MAG: ribosomal RNA small subunit methyltransferase A [Lentisphaerae bacterium]|nr:ribosomal RNA small subunit methyltransferase A [Lentisphaerota bacterium]
MKKAELCVLFERLGLHPSRKLGQNFLVDVNLLEAMVHSAAPLPGERILEIGPGAGTMTEKLLESGCELTAVEIDHRLVSWLRERFAGRSNFTLLEGDACKLDYQQIFGAEPYRCIANLPYSCGSVFLANISEQPNPPQEMFILLQKEMGDRLIAEPDTKDYGVLTVRLRCRYQIKMLRSISPKVFFPEPEVVSAFLQLTLKTNLPETRIVQLASKLAGCAFSQRRKKASKLLQSLYPASAIAEAFGELGISPEARAEHLSPEQYLALAGILLEEESIL